MASDEPLSAKLKGNLKKNLKSLIKKQARSYLCCSAISLIF